MKNVEEIRKRYLKDELPVRLGGIAANLARMKSFSSNDNHLEAIESLLDESKYYIEWTVKETPVETQGFLIQIQIQLALWQVQLIKIWTDNKKRHFFANRANTWSQELLKLAGLM
jgi:hypothetical protein